MKKPILLNLLLLLMLMPRLSFADTLEERAQNKHEVRLLVGDMLFESLMWYDNLHLNYAGAGTASSVFYENRHYTYTPHMALEYQYRFNRWFGLGLQADMQLTAWRRLGYNNRNEEVSSERKNFYNICFLPTARFTFFHSPYVDLYAAIGAGLDINGGTEPDIYQRRVACGAALDIVPFGVAFGKGRWFGSLEVGGLFALKNKQTMFMMNSRILAAGVGVTF